MPSRAPARSAARGSLRRKALSAMANAMNPTRCSSSFRRDAIQLCPQPYAKRVARLDRYVVVRDGDIVVFYVVSLAELDPILAGYDDGPAWRQVREEVT